MRLPEPSHIKKMTPKPPRPNIMMFCVIIMTVLLGVAAPLRGISQPPVTFERFSEQMLKQRDVDHVISYKSGDLLNVEVYLKKASLNKPEYADAGKESSPQYTFTAAAYDGLVKGINDAETRFGYAEGDKIPVSIEAGHESLDANGLVQSIIMLFLLILLALCGYLGYKSGKNRIIGSIGGLLLGVVLGPVGLIIVNVTEKKPL